MRFANTAYHGPEAVGVTRRARDKVLAAVVLVGVEVHDDDLGVVLGRGQVDDLLGVAADDGLGGLLGEKDAGGLTDEVSAKGAPPNLIGVAAAGGLDLLVVEDNGALGNAVDGVVLTSEDNGR